VLCGPALAADARTVLAAQTPPSGGETAAVPQLVVDARIKDARWYLACDPDAWPTVAVAHLTDQATPLVDTRDGWDIEGREVRARLDVAAVAADYRGLVLTPPPASARMLTPSPAPYFDRMLGWLAPQWQLRRLRARAALAELAADLADPSRTRRIGGERWRRVDGTPNAPERAGGYRLVR